MVVIERLSDGKRVDVIDADCEFRPCFRFGFDKGPFTPGVGYTRYYDKPRPVCLENHLHGCPHKPDEFTLKCDDCRTPVEDGKPCCRCGCTETYRMAVLLDPLPCCDSPRVPKSRKDSLPTKQRCKSCGQRLTGTRLEYARAAA